MDDYSNLIDARKHTYQTIMQCNSLEEIKSFLPKPYQSNFDSFLNGLEKYIKKEIAGYKELYSECSGNEEKQEIDESIKKLEDIILYISEYRSSFEKSDKNDTIVDNSLKMSIIFGTSPSGNNCFLGDLKKIDREYLNEIQKMLINFSLKKDNVDIKKMQGGFLNLYELRSVKYGIRILFRPLNNKSVYLTMIRIKRANNSLKDNTEPRNRLSLLDKDYERVKEGLKNSEIKNEIEAKADRDMEEIVAYINANRIVNGGGYHRN